MSQFEPSFPPQDNAAQKMSGLAIASLVCSLLFCCPLATIPGVLLGIGALVSIGSNPMRRGKGIAITGIALGILFTVGQALTFPPAFRMARDTFVLMQSGPGEALAAGFSGDDAGFRARFFKAGSQASDADVQAFIAALRARYGEFVAAFPLQSNQPPFGQTVITMKYSLQFDRATVTADVELVFADPATGEWAAKLGSILVSDPDEGDLTFPPQPGEPRPSGGGGGGGGEGGGGGG
jgi:hypothetical protein